MQWHGLTADMPKQDVDKFELQALKNTHTDFPNVPTRYRSSYFLHIWANGYAAGYYAYQWTVMLDDDAFAWFTSHGGMTRANGQRFRDMILSKGHSEDYGRCSVLSTARIPTPARCSNTVDWRRRSIKAYFTLCKARCGPNDRGRAFFWLNFLEESV